MKKVTTGILGASLVLASAGFSHSVLADSVSEAFSSGKAYGDFRLRYEEVDAASTTDALTLRTKLGFKTGVVNGFSAVIEFEDVRAVLGQSEVGNAIPDPDEALTELDQGFIQYKNDLLTAKLGRQVLTLDGHRHVGHVGWRQDKQTFDAARATFKPMDDLTVDLSYIYRVNRINSPHFADIEDTSYKLLNVSYKTPFGKLVGYNYALSAENSGPAWDETNTVGVSFSGKTKGDVKFLYSLEFATQDNESVDVETDYSLIELGVALSGVTAKVGVETLGSDTSSAGVTENFQTPLATVHKFQGWADQLLGGSLFGTIDGGNGVEDTYVSFAGKAAGIKLVGVYHEYDSEGGSNDLGDELNLLAVKKFNKTYSAGVKYAAYSKGDVGTDTDKVWVWVGAKF